MTPHETITARPLWRYRELFDEGLSRRQIQQAVADGDLMKLRKNAYVSGERWAELAPQERLALAAEAHHHSLIGRPTERHVYSHETAAVLHGLSLWKPGSDVHVTQRTRTSNASHGPDVRNHCADLSTDDVVVLRGLEVTSLLRTAVDCARTLPFDKGLIVVDQCLARGVERRAAIAALEVLGPVRGAARARDIIAAADPLSESAGETLTRGRLIRFHLPTAVTQFVVDTRAGRHRLDFAWPEILLGLEFDGRIKYFGDAPTDEVLFQERRRERALTEAGWMIMRIEWRDLFTDADLEARIRRAIQQATTRTALRGAHS